MTDQMQPCASAHRLRLARRAAGLTRSQLARALGIPRRQYLAYEEGAPLPPHLLSALCALTRCSRQYFLTGEHFSPHQTVFHADGNLAVRLNLCGAPCTVGQSWCTEGCKKGAG